MTMNMTMTEESPLPISAARAAALTRIEEILGGNGALERRYGPTLVKRHTPEGLRLSYSDPTDPRSHIRALFINPNPIVRHTYDVRVFRARARVAGLPEMEGRYIGVEPGELLELVHHHDGIRAAQAAQAAGEAFATAAAAAKASPAPPTTRGAVARLAALAEARAACETAAAAARVALGIPAGCPLVDLTDEEWNGHTKVAWNGDVVLNHKKLAPGETFRRGDSHRQIRLNRPRVIRHPDEGLVAYGGPSEGGGPTDTWYVFSLARKNPAL